LKGGLPTLTEPAFISLGSNIEPKSNLLAAAKALSTLGVATAASNVYRNPAVGPIPQPDYLNAAVCISTQLQALEIRRMLREIERDLGRIRTQDKYAPRTIDLDLCLLGGLILNQDPLILPDPDLVERAHLAVPMAELDAEFIHPVLNRNLASIAADLAPYDDLELLPDFSIRFQRICLHDDQPV
jgi:2-amino-4-hydroxy-6-hydroxymethyldihydropteridine diphosphokinase